jgi:hypothetical protein
LRAAVSAQASFRNADALDALHALHSLLSAPCAELDEPRAERYVDAIDALGLPPTAEEAVALLTVFPSDESTSFALAWSILHAIEASPAWPVWSALDRNWWVTYLRERSERAD